MLALLGFLDWFVFPFFQPWFCVYLNHAIYSTELYFFFFLPGDFAAEAHVCMTGPDWLLSYFYSYHPRSTIYNFLGCWIQRFIDLMLSLFLTFSPQVAASGLQKLKGIAWLPVQILHNFSLVYSHPEKYRKQNSRRSNSSLSNLITKKDTVVFPLLTWHSFNF